MSRTDCRRAAADPRPRWQGLLVSVRDAAEARVAHAAGAAIIDVKDPARGPLGAADPDVAAAVGRLLAGDAAPWTLACGELAEGVAAAHVDRVAATAGGVPTAAKAGPAGLPIDAWRDAFVAFSRSLPVGVEAVAVAYADWQRVAAPEPAMLIAAAAAFGCRTILFDTGDKRGPGLLAAEHAAAARGWIAAARAAGLAVAAAGRLALADMPHALALGADVVAMRGAVCRGGRSGRVDRTLVRAAVTLVESLPRLAACRAVADPASFPPSGART